ncbi:MAG TPA: tetratricopeptide repeat protein [Gemmatimonadaceae bacterium]|nr:tetratricopeptide repeat protein [Gemmatimonadaceae bacterium]
MQSSARIDELRQKFHENPRRYFAPLANEYRKAGDPEQAIAICRAHLAQQPAHMSGHVVYARALYDAGRMDESRVVFEKALSLDPDNAIVLRQLGDISRQKGDSAEARHWYTRALDADPHDREIAAYIAELTEPVTETESVPVGAEEAPEATVLVEATPEPAAVAEETSEPVQGEQVSAPVDVEVDIPAAEEPPALADMPGFEAEEALFAADEDVELFPDSSSPFVTRTMADLYARQGYNDQALEVYKKLAADNPHDQEIAARIRDLSQAEPAPPADSAPPVEPVAADAVSTDAPPAPAEEKDELPLNEFSDTGDFEVDFGFPSADQSTTTGTDSDAYQFVGQSTEAPSTESPDKPVHFTDTELGGDQWDSSSWGAGFAADESETASLEDDSLAPLHVEEFEQLVTVGDSPAATPPVGVFNDTREEETHTEIYRPADEPIPTPSEPEIPVEREATPPVEPEEFEREVPEAEEVDEAWRPDDTTAEDPEAALYADSADAESESFVAYSPQPPEDDDLPHYTPVGPTIRELFATLGASRPAENGSTSFTARAAVPEMGSGPLAYESEQPAVADGEPSSPYAEPAQEPDEFPLVTDAFANLFPDSPVSEEDSKAAFALSGALSSQPDEPTARPYPTPPSPAPAVDEPAPPAATHESEEDLRRFREWLDGLAES